MKPSTSIFSASRRKLPPTPTLTPPPVIDIENPFGQGRFHEDLVPESLGSRTSSIRLVERDALIPTSIRYGLGIDLPDIVVVAPEEEGTPTYAFCVFRGDVPPSPPTPEMDLRAALIQLERRTESTPAFRRPSHMGTFLEEAFVVLPKKKDSLDEESDHVVGGFKASECPKSNSQRVTSALKGILRNVRPIPTPTPSPGRRGWPLLKRDPDPTVEIMEVDAVEIENSLGYIDVRSITPSLGYQTHQNPKRRAGFSTFLARSRQAFTPPASHRGFSPPPVLQSKTLYKHTMSNSSSQSLPASKRGGGSGSHSRSRMEKDLPPIPVLYTKTTPLSAASGGRTVVQPTPRTPREEYTVMDLPLAGIGHSPPRIRHKTKPFSSIRDILASRATRPSASKYQATHHDSPPPCMTSPRTFLARFSLQSSSEFPPRVESSELNSSISQDYVVPGVSSENQELSTTTPAECMTQLNSLHFSELSFDLSVI